MSVAPPLLVSGRPVSAIHLVGVGGMGVGPLALYLAQLGFVVSGEDDALTAPMQVLLARGGVTVTATGAVPAACGLVAHSSAIPPDHPAVTAARARGLPLLRRGELLAAVTRGQKLVAVCGSHGKTTTSAMLASALDAAGFPAGYVLGGLPADGSAPARAGTNGWVVAEIDESDGTIAQFSPEITVAVNLDWDHPDHYPRLADLEAEFGALFDRTRGTVLVSDACALSRRLAAGRPKVRTFGRTGDYRGGVGTGTAGRIGLSLGGLLPPVEITVRAAGEFNAANATAALAAAHLMGVTLSPGLLAGYAGVRRRQTVLLATEGLTVLEDYAHHPAEIRALLGSLRSRAGGRLVVVFQPHRFSRSAQFKAEFAAALAAADALFLIDVYGAGEAPVAGGTTADLRAALHAAAPALAVTYRPDDADGTLAALTQDRRPGDLVAFVGAGDIDGLARRWLQTAATNSQTERWSGHAAALSAAVSAGTRVGQEEPLASRTTMRVGGAARLYAEPADMADLQALVHGARARGVPVLLLGRGSNLIVPDAGVDALVLSLRAPAWEKFEPRADGTVWAGAGLRLKNLCGLATKAGLAGFEFLEGIPGNLGGALRMNAGAMGGWIFDVVESVQLLTPEGEVCIVSRTDLHVGYRHCDELHEGIALGALLRPAAPSAAAEISRQIDVYRDRRQKSQPREPSAGCIFKNPPGDSAGRLIDVSGLKRARVGDAAVSEVHANFIINAGHATAADVIGLVRQVRARVAATQGVWLEPEVLLFGGDWGDVL